MAELAPYHLNPYNTEVSNSVIPFAAYGSYFDPSIPATYLKHHAHRNYLNRSHPPLSAIHTFIHISCSDSGENKRFASAVAYQTK